MAVFKGTDPLDMEKTVQGCVVTDKFIVYFAFVLSGGLMNNWIEPNRSNTDLLMRNPSFIDGYHGVYIFIPIHNKVCFIPI